jgi:hypothetical protein
MDARLAPLADQNLLRAGDDRLTAGGLVADSRRSTTADLHRLRAGRDDRDGAVGTPRRREIADRLLPTTAAGIPSIRTDGTPGGSTEPGQRRGSRSRRFLRRPRWFPPLATRWRPCPHLLRRRHRGHSPTEAWLNRGQEHDKRVRRASLAETSCESARVRATRCRPGRSVV